MKITDINVDGTQITRDATPEELEGFAISEASRKKIEKEFTDKAADKISAMAKLAALGLTEEEVASILG